MSAKKKKRYKQRQLKKISIALGLPLAEIKEVVDDQISMELLHNIKDDEWEVFDGKEWQKLQL